MDEHGWTLLLHAIATVALQRDPGPVIALDDQALTTRQLVQRAIDHIRAHIAQVGALRPDAPDPPGSA